MRLTGLLSIVAADDVGVVEASRRLDFSAEAFGRLRVGDEFGRDDLQCSRLAHYDMLGQVNRSHPSLTEQPDNSVTRMIDQARRHIDSEHWDAGARLGLGLRIAK
jgi:hypothetical protein